ncbi:MAG: hypothetical protein J6P93_05395 [Alphaproteobacteria bacterium]|nr:hypothetical protein [Alphaproteobacteria bacterium]
MIKERLNGYRFEKAVVGFGGQPTLWWMRFLKKGFYHCFVALGRQNEWIIIDPLLHFTDVILVRDINIYSFFKKRGYRFVDVLLKEPQKIRLRVMPYTCVETVKRFIGVDKSFIFTPYRLFCYLNKK